MSSAAAQFFRSLCKLESPLQILGVQNAFTALMAKQCGYRCIYLSGAGVSNQCFGLPDVGLTTLNDVAEECRRITSAVDLPLIVDIDTGWGAERMIDRTIKTLIQAGAAGVHIEDQHSDKRCGHLESKKLVSKSEMVARIAAAVEARKDSSLLIIARTDALAVEGFESTIERSKAYAQAGAEVLFAEAFTDLNQYALIKEATGLPILANCTEFGKTPLVTLKEFGKFGVDMVLYPLSCTRAMNLAALKVMEDIRKNGTQKASLEQMQTRQELYRFLNYNPNEV